MEKMKKGDLRQMCLFFELDISARKSVSYMQAISTCLVRSSSFRQQKIIHENLNPRQKASALYLDQTSLMPLFISLFFSKANSSLLSQFSGQKYTCFISNPVRFSYDTVTIVNLYLQILYRSMASNSEEGQGPQGAVVPMMMMMMIIQMDEFEGIRTNFSDISNATIKFST
jgi:hypothetical protein